VSDAGGGGRLRIYVDTSVIGGCLDPEFAGASRRLFDALEAGKHVLVLSSVTIGELELAPEAVRAVIDRVPAGHVERLRLTPEGERLAELYLAAGVIPKRMTADAQHIAAATLAEVDVLVSWNFKHVVNLRRIMGFNAVNLGMGLQPLEIRTPLEVVGDED
jgi:predicted nucleic acid-binding protein